MDYVRYCGGCGGTAMSDTRTCWLAETGEKQQKADYEALRLTKPRAKFQLKEWERTLGSENRWFSVTKMEAVVADD